jgi:hypothetical protein
MLEEFSTFARHDTGAFLPAMLQGIEAEVGQFSGVGMAINAKDSAVMFGVVFTLLHRARRVIFTDANAQSKAGKISLLTKVDSCLLFQ